MIKDLLKRAIEQKNQFMGEDMIKLQIEFFLTAGKLSEADKTELLDLMNPVVLIHSVQQITVPSNEEE